MGSEFAYEGLTSQEVDKYIYKWLREEQLKGKKVAVMERYPTYKNSGCTRQVAWVDLAVLQAVKVEYYDRKNALLKTLELDGFKQYDGGFWRPSKMVMTNHQTGKSTALTWSAYKFATGLTAKDFTKNSLKRVH